MFLNHYRCWAAGAIISFMLIWISWHGFDFVPGKLPESSFCEKDIGGEMNRQGHQEDLVWRGCLVASETQQYFKRYTQTNDVFGFKHAGRKLSKGSCLSCHDNVTAPDFAQIWTQYPKYSPELGRLIGLSKAIKDEIELRYGGTRPDRYDIKVTSLYNYAFASAKKQGLRFNVESQDDAPISEQMLQFLRVTDTCRKVFAEKGGVPRGPIAEYVVKGCNVITDTWNSMPELLKVWRTDMKCQSCHRQGGTVKNAAPLAYGAVLLPIVSTRAYKPIRFHRRALMCFARSLNWLDLGRDSPFPDYVHAYANWLAQRDDLQIGVLYEGRGIPMMYDTQGLGSSILAGEAVFNQYCYGCHGENAWGGMGLVWNGEEPPPIAGPHSFNGSASMSKRPRLAGFIYNNMPQGATPENPILTVQQSLDVALYLQSFGRASDFTHANRATIFANYLWQSSIYHGYKGMQYIQRVMNRDEGLIVGKARNKEPPASSREIDNKKDINSNT